MIRKQFFIEEMQNKRLKSVALLTGRSEADIIRAGIDQVLEQQAGSSEDWKPGLLSIAGLWADYPDAEKALIDRRGRRRARRDRTIKLMRRK